VLEVDIEKFFDTIDHAHLREVLGRRVGDGAIHRMIGKWLNAGVMEDEVLTHPETGTPQGGVISPILANIFLHGVLDVWFRDDVKTRLKGRATLVRYADDFVIVFEQEDDARRVLDALPKRFGKYGLTLHPTKTRLFPFERPPRNSGDPGRTAPKMETFDFLGFTHMWRRSAAGNWVVMLKTAKSRLARAAKRIDDWCRANRHLPIKEQHRMLTRKLEGHDNYYGVVGNLGALLHVRRKVTWAWRRWLDRRSQRARMTWKRMSALLKRLPLPRAPERLLDLRT